MSESTEIEVGVVTGISMGQYGTDPVLDRRTFTRKTTLEEYGQLAVRAFGARDRRVAIQADVIVEGTELGFVLAEDLRNNDNRFVCGHWPDVNITPQGHWLLVDVHCQTWPLRLFFHRKGSDLPYEHVPIPEGWSVQGANHDLSFKIGKDHFDIGSNGDHYPSALLFPNLYVGIRRLGRLLACRPGETLHTMRHSPQPMKGMTIAVTDQLEEIEQELLAAYSEIS